MLTDDQTPFLGTPLATVKDKKTRGKSSSETPSQGLESGRHGFDIWARANTPAAQTRSLHRDMRPGLRRVCIGYMNRACIGYASLYDSSIG